MIFNFLCNNIYFKVEEFAIKVGKVYLKSYFKCTSNVAKLVLIFWLNNSFVDIYIPEEQ